LPPKQEKEAFMVIDQDRDDVISKGDLIDTYAAMGCLNVPREVLDAMMNESKGPINFTTFLTMFGKRLKGLDPEDVTTAAFKTLDPEGKGTIKKDYLENLLQTQCNRFSDDEMKNMWAVFPPDLGGNIDYRNISYIITHGKEKGE
uniref:Myosin light chain 11 n=1 Tax=Scleropages formosus TaxID=113540 RepID=A0A8C9RXR4_SCLFO